MDNGELIDALIAAGFDHRADHVWVEDENSYWRIERVYAADGGIYIKLIDEVPASKPHE